MPLAFSCGMNYGIFYSLLDELVKRYPRHDGLLKRDYVQRRGDTYVKASLAGLQRLFTRLLAESDIVIHRFMKSPREFRDAISFKGYKVVYAFELAMKNRIVRTEVDRADKPLVN
jgi:hypothetical protein